MSQRVWVACGMGSPVIGKQLRSALSMSNLSLSAEHQRRNEVGEQLSREYFPEAVYGTEHAPRFERMPPFFRAGSALCVSTACRDVLQQFDLGRSAFYPIAIYQKDHKTLVPGEYFAINFANTKNALLPEQSTTIQQSRENYWTLPGWITDDELAVTPAALEGPDWWLDERLYKTLFMSDRMAQAIKRAKMSRNFELKRCRVVDAASSAKGDET
jgi:hypothetical protein